MRKRPIKVYLSKEQVEMLDRACQAIGEDRSRFISMALLNYLKDINLVRKRVHGGETLPDHA